MLEETHGISKRAWLRDLHFQHRFTDFQESESLRDASPGTQELLSNLQVREAENWKRNFDIAQRYAEDDVLIIVPMGDIDD